MSAPTQHATALRHQTLSRASSWEGQAFGGIVRVRVAEGRVGHRHVETDSFHHCIGCRDMGLEKSLEDHFVREGQDEHQPTRYPIDGTRKDGG